MRYKKFSFMFLLIVFLSGCGTTYVYYGTIEDENSLGKEREHLLYWRKTERPFWYDECDGSVRLLTECSRETIEFKETADGIIFIRPKNYHIGVTHDVKSGEPCGEILNAKKISDLTEGKLLLKIYCTYDYSDFTSGDHSYLKAQDEAYEFDIIREKSSEFESGAPKRPECRE
jgi:hypothetical protein